MANRFKTRLEHLRKPLPSDNGQAVYAKDGNQAVRATDTANTKEAGETAQGDTTLPAQPLLTDAPEGTQNTQFKKQLQRMRARRFTAKPASPPDAGNLDSKYIAQADAKPNLNTTASLPDTRNLDAANTAHDDDRNCKTIIASNHYTTSTAASFNPGAWEQVCPYVELYRYDAPLPAEFTTHIARDWSSLIPQSKLLFTKLDKPETVPITSLLFFDLETTGLSGGAGTVAFLAAFGSFLQRTDVQWAFSVRQYLLLDYIGEPEFLAAISRELTGTSTYAHSNCSTPYLVSYNGRAFDEQILRTRFIISGLEFPSPPCHFDLLYPSRMLWKYCLDNCSQKTIESLILGIDRGYDLPGEFAPYAWFEYLRTGNRTRLEENALHNRKDIEGLSNIFFAINTILEKPEDSPRKFNKTRLGMKLNEEGKKLSLLKSSSQENDEALLEYGSLCLKKGLIHEGLSALKNLAGKTAASSLLRGEALRKLAIHAEWDTRNYREALHYTEHALQLQFLTPEIKKDLQKRKTRLKNKLP